jgi:DNA-binding transcriptional LysR family regulator
MASFDERVTNGISVLSAIVDSGTFAAAGDILNMSQSGVSRSIARLEARLGIRLLERTTRSVSLTDEGRRFYEQVVPLLAGLEEAAASAAQGTTAVRGRLRQSRSLFLADLAEAAHFESYPQLRLELTRRIAWETWWATVSTWQCASAILARRP